MSGESLHTYIPSIVNALKNKSLIDLNSFCDMVRLEAGEPKTKRFHLKNTIRENYPSFEELVLLLPKKEQDIREFLHILMQVILALIEFSLLEGGMRDYFTGKPILARNPTMNQLIDQLYTNNTGELRRFL